MTAPRAVIFDLDGTLIDSAVAATNVLNTMLASRGLPPTDKASAAKWVSLGAKALITNALGNHVKDLEGEIAEFRRIYRAMQPDPAELFPHTLEMLADLQARNIKLGVCTNKPEDLAHHVIKGVGLAPYLQAIVGGREGLPPKPDAAPIHAALKLLNATPADAIYIGDSEVDAEAATAAGLPFYLVTFGYAIGDIDQIKSTGRIDGFQNIRSLQLT